MSDQDQAARIEAELQAMAAALRAGNDVAPARRAQLEGAIALALDAGWIDDARVEAWARDDLRECGALDIERRQAFWVVRLLLWQRRAPVSPTTSE